MRQRAIGLAALLAASLVGRLARADVPMPARVDFTRPGCSPMAFDEQGFVALLRIELATDGVDELTVRDPEKMPAAPTAQALAVLTIENACAADASVRIAIDDAATDKRVERVVELASVPERARARVLALAVAELLRASWAELVLPEAPPPRTPVPPQVKQATSERLQRVVEPAVAPPERPAVAPQPSRDGLLLVAAPEARFFFQERLGLGGLRIGPSIPLGRRTPLRLKLHAGSAYGAGRDGSDSFNAWLVSSGAGLTAGGGSRSAALELGPQFDLGWGWRRFGERAQSDAPTSSDGVLAAVSIVASGRVRLAGAWWSIADVEIGQAIASDGAGARTDGATAGARLGFALSP